MDRIHLKHINENKVMTTIKSYTDLEQSKKLAEILPIESADMVYIWHATSDNPTFRFDEDMPPMVLKDVPIDEITADTLPCWSLATLLATLPNEIITDNRFECHYQIHIRKYDGGDNTTLHQIAYGNDRGSSGSWHDMINTGEKESLIDCCVQMIVYLKERNFI